MPSRSNIKLYLSIRWKLILSIILPLIIITAVVMGFTLTRIFEFASVSIREQELGELNLYAQGIGAEFEGLSQIATTTANILSLDDDVTGEELYDILASNVENNPLVYGAAVAWEPFAWNDDTRLFSPYVFEDGDSLSAIDIGAESYDYTDGNWEWYSGVLEQGQAIWTEPYFDEGAGNVLMTTFSAPIFRDGAFAGVTTVDVRLDALNEDAALQFSDENFMILSQSGHFITHYNPDLVMNSTIQDQVAMQNNPEFSTAVERMLAGEFWVSEVNDMFLKGGMVEGESWLFYTPVNATGWILSSTLPRSQLTSELWSLMSMAIYGLALMIVLIIALTLYVSSRLSRPIKTLSAAVSDVARGKLDTSIEKIYSMDELGRLSVGFNRMLKNLKKQVEIQSQQTAARQMVEKELQVARETQQALLPSEFPPFPERREFQLHAVSKAARHVAGDFFDFFLINPRTLVFVIADVSGKGMSAALVMAVTRTIVRNLAENGKTPARILAETNELLRESHGGSAFVTILLGIYNTNSGRIMYANGGHSPPLLVDRHGNARSVGEATGTIVGMLENQEYANAEMRLLPGETLLLFTDGITEARSPGGEFYGEGRIRAFLEANHGKSAEALCDTLEKEICDFQKMNLADDLTILALRRIGSRMTRVLEDLFKAKKSE